MFGKGWDEYLRGFTSEQYSLALFNTLLNYLQMKELIDIDEYKEFQSQHFELVLKSIIEYDEQEKKKKVEEIAKSMKEKEEKE